MEEFLSQVMPRTESGGYSAPQNFLGREVGASLRIGAERGMERGEWLCPQCSKIDRFWPGDWSNPLVLRQHWREFSVKRCERDVLCYLS